MTIIETTKMTSKGQVTIPSRVRKLLHLKQGSSVAFGVTKDGIYLVPCEVKACSPYSTAEWKKIESIAAEKGSVYSTPSSAKKHLTGL